MSWQPPVEEIAFTLEHIAGLSHLRAQCSEEEQAAGEGMAASPELVRAILEEGGKWAEQVLAPLNRDGDETGARLEESRVITPKGFAEAYQSFCEHGWGSVSAPPKWGGQGLPFSVNIALQEMFNAACMSFALCPMLSSAAIEALEAHGTSEQQTFYLPKLISGEWTGSMNLTEPQAGSDVGALKTKAVPQEDGSYRISGTKIFITYGEHDWTENIIHLVLARLPDAPEGTRGISLFLVPKFIEGKRNDVFCIGLEKKLGIHASPTCTLRFGETEGATGWLIGAPNKGMAAMFTMMNQARLQVGIEGVGLAGRAFLQAQAYAAERVQGQMEGKPVAIDNHPDVQRMLMMMRSSWQASRAVCFATAGALDMARKGGSVEIRAAAQARADLLTPIAKAWSTDIGVESASLGVQIHGGMGFIEETGAAQIWRDSRIAPIYEGTNGIQANDLVGRKLRRDKGTAMMAFLGEIEEEAQRVAGDNRTELAASGAALAEAAEALREATDFMVKAEEQDALAGAYPYLQLAGQVAGGYFLTRLARIEGEENSPAGGFSQSAGFFAQTQLPHASALTRAASAGVAALGKPA